MKDIRVLIIAPTSIDELEKKGNSSHLVLREENGLVCRVVSLHPFSRCNFDRPLSPGHRLVERSWSREGNPLLRRIRNGIQLFRLLRLSKALIREENINLIRANDPFTTGLLGLIIAWIARVPFVVSYHSEYLRQSEISSSSIPTALGRESVSVAIASLVLRKAKLVLPIRTSMVGELNRIGAPPEKIRVFPHFLPLSLVAPPESANENTVVEPTKPYGLIACRLVDENLVDDAIRAIAGCQNKLKIDLLVAGSGPRETELRKLADSLKVSVTFLGNLPTKTVQALRQKAAFNLCLIGGFSLIEACLSRQPVITYDVEWHRELIRNGESGFLISYRNIDECSRAIDSVFRTPETSKILALRAAGLAEEQFCSEKVVLRRLRSYQEAIEDSK